MKRIVCMVAAAAAVCLTGCAKPKAAAEQTKTLVAYFSATGTTERAARLIAETTGGTLLPIAPQAPYTADDLNWNNKQSRSSKEMTDAAARPAVTNTVADVQAYDTVFVGYPIWWNEAPRVVNTFIEQCTLSGKVVIPFATSGGSSIGNSVSKLRAAYPQLDWREGRLLNGAGRVEVEAWLRDLQ